jgi:hypothetical protein
MQVIPADDVLSIGCYQAVVAGRYGATFGKQESLRRGWPYLLGFLRLFDSPLSFLALPALRAAVLTLMYRGLASPRIVLSSFRASRAVRGLYPLLTSSFSRVATSCASIPLSGRWPNRGRIISSIMPLYVFSEAAAATYERIAGEQRRGSRRCRPRLSDTSQLRSGHAAGSRLFLYRANELAFTHISCIRYV